MLLIAIEHLPAGTAAVLARQNGETILGLADWLSPTQIVAAENVALNRSGACVIVLRDDIISTQKKEAPAPD